MPLPTLARVLTSQSTAFLVSLAYFFEDDPVIKLSSSYPNLSVSSVSCGALTTHINRNLV